MKDERDGLTDECANELRIILSERMDRFRLLIERKERKKRFRLDRYLSSFAEKNCSGGFPTVSVYTRERKNSEKLKKIENSLI